MKLNGNTTESADTSVSWSFSTDGGSTWIPIIINASLPTELTQPTREVILRAILNGTITETPAINSYKLTVYGAWTIGPGVDPDLRFTGKELDISTGLEYFGARYYDPEVGRFISVDPAQDGLNWYVYCSNNPVRFLDTNGLWKKDGTNWIAKKGDTLGGLAKIVYGKGSEWERLGYTGDPAKLQIGTRVADPIESTLQANAEWASENRGLVGKTEWVLKVAPHGEWDYKNNPDWQGTTYNWNGLTLTVEDFGNLNYGPTGAALGLSEEWVTLGGAAANLAFGSIKSPLDSSALGDDPRDVFFVELGYEYYSVLTGEETFTDALWTAYYEVY